MLVGLLARRYTEFDISVFLHAGIYACYCAQSLYTVITLQVLLIPSIRDERAIYRSPLRAYPTSSVYSIAAPVLGGIVGGGAPAEIEFLHILA